MDTPPTLSDSLLNSYHQQQSPLFRTKAVVAATLAVIFISYRLWYSNSTPQCLNDVTHQITAQFNTKLNRQSAYYQISALLAQYSLDLEITIFAITALLRMQSLYIHLFAALFYGIRAAFLNIQKFPFPEGWVFYQPYLPSMTVPYDHTRDFFYSGHTGAMVFSLLLWNRLNYKGLFRLTCVLTTIVVVFLVSTRVHYCVDIIGGAIFALWIDKHLVPVLIRPFDHIWSFIIVKLFEWGSKIYNTIR